MPMLDTTTKRYRRGTHRITAPEDTWERIKPLLEAFGITRVADVTGLDDVGIPVFQAIRPDALSLAVSQGKGLTPCLARVSAVMEAIELWHAERLDGVVVWGSARDVDPLPYALTDLTLTSRSLASEHLQLGWLEGMAVLSGAPVFVPRDYVRLSGVLREQWAPPVFAPTSNGLASGNSFVEAAVHALCELAERDCTSEFWQRPVARWVPVDLTTVDDPDCRHLLDRYAAAANTVEVFDATNDLGITCYQVFIWSPALPLRFSGVGCHLDPRVALARGLTEAAQSRLTAITGARDDLPPDLYTLQPELALRHSQGNETANPVPFARWPTTPSNSLDTDLVVIASRIQERTGVEPFIVDLTRPPHRVPVVKAVAPGLRFDSRTVFTPSSGRGQPV